MLPAMFIIPETVPEYFPPTSIGTDHDGPIVHSRKNIATVRQASAKYAFSVSAAGTMKTQVPNMPTIATRRREKFVRPVFLSSQSLAMPPTVSPITPAHSGSEPKMP